MDKLDITLFPVYFLFRITFSILYCIFKYISATYDHAPVFLGSAFTNGATWLAYLVLSLALYAILLLHEVLYHFTFMMQCAYRLLTYWPYFYWTLLGPNSKGRSIFSILFNSHAAPRSLQRGDLALNSFQHEGLGLKVPHEKPHCTLAEYNVYTGIQFAREHKNHAQSCNRQMFEALTSPPSPRHIPDPLRLSVAYNWIN